jgi:hypothetical protein
MFEQFQAQQKKAKDEERKKKTEAAAALQGYRKTGLTDEEAKIALLREQERQRKAEAAALLQQYRKAGLSEEEAKAAAAKQEEIRRKQMMEEQLRNNGVVSAHDPSVHSSLLGMENSGAVSAMAAQFGVEKNDDNKFSIPVVESTARTVTDIAPEAAADEAVAHVPITTPVIPVNVESSVDFVFGLITATSDELVTDGYLARADQIVKNILTSNTESFGSSISAVAYPKVRSITKDNGTSCSFTILSAHSHLCLFLSNLLLL